MPFVYTDFSVPRYVFSCVKGSFWMVSPRSTLPAQCLSHNVPLPAPLPHDSEFAHLLGRCTVKWKPALQRWGLQLPVGLASCRGWVESWRWQMTLGVEWAESCLVLVFCFVCLQGFSPPGTAPLYSFFLYCFCVSTRVYILVCMYVHTQVWRPEVDIVFFYHSPHCSLRQGLTLHFNWTGWSASPRDPLCLLCTGIACMQWLSLPILYLFFSWERVILCSQG